jgi:hypothetical protein
MPQIESWPRIPAPIRNHLVERMRDRNMNLDDLNQLRAWLETKPNVPPPTLRLYTSTFLELTGIPPKRHYSAADLGSISRHH